MLRSTNWGSLDVGKNKGGGGRGEEHYEKGTQLWKLSFAPRETGRMEEDVELGESPTRIGRQRSSLREHAVWRKQRHEVKQMKTVVRMKLKQDFRLVTAYPGGLLPGHIIVINHSLHT